MRQFVIGFFGDGLWALYALELFIADPEVKLAFVCSRFPTPDPSLERLAHQYDIKHLVHVDVNSIEFLNMVPPDDLFGAIPIWLGVYAVSAFAFGLTGAIFYRRFFRLMLLGKPAGRLDHPVRRIVGAVPLIFGQRKVLQKMQFMAGSNPELYGLPKPNHKFFEAHPTQSVELPLRLGSGDVTPKPNVSRLDGSTVHFEDGTAQEFDVVIQATGYNTSFPFFDPEFLSADAHNHVPLYKRMFSPGIDDLVMVGFAQSTPTLFPFVEAQARLAAAWAAGLYRTPPRAEMERAIVADEKKYIGHMLDTPRHQQQVDYFLYEHDLRTHEIPRGRERAARSGGMIRTAAPA